MEMCWYYIETNSYTNYVLFDAAIEEHILYILHKLYRLLTESSGRSCFCTRLKCKHVRNPIPLTLFDREK